MLTLKQKDLLKEYHRQIKEKLETTGRLSEVFHKALIFNIKLNK